MKLITTTLVALAMFMSTAAMSQLASSNSDADQVRTFGMEIIQRYFNNDCNYVFDRLHTTVTSFEGGHSISIGPEVKKAFCSESPLRQDIAVTYQMYLDNYAPEVLTAKQLKIQFPEWHNHLNVQPGDYMFFGSKQKAAGAKRVFTASDMARFLVRKINGEWKIIAM